MSMICSMHSPRSPMEGLIEGIVTPMCSSPMPMEEGQEPADYEQADRVDSTPLMRVQSMPARTPQEDVVDGDSFEQSILQEARRLSPKPEDENGSFGNDHGILGNRTGMSMAYGPGGPGGPGMGVGMGMRAGMGMGGGMDLPMRDRQAYHRPMGGYGNYPPGYGNPAAGPCMF